MGLSLRGTTSGAVDINAPAVAGDNTITLPDNNGAANQFYKNSGTAGIVIHSSMVEDSSGRIGIGTDAVTTNFKSEIRGDTYQLRLSNGGNTKSLRLGVNDPEISSTGATFDIRTTDAEAMVFRTNNTERMRITSGGNIGIGNIDPGTMLHISDSSNDGSFRLGGNNAGESGFNVLYENGGTTYTILRQLYATTNANAYTSIHTGYFTVNTGTSLAERIRIDSSGRLLLGTSTASGYSSSRMIITGAGTDATGSGNLVLQVGQANGSITADEQIGSINFGDTSGYSYANIVAWSDLAAGSDSPGRLVFSTTADGASSPTERMRIDSTGAVQIGSGGKLATEKFRVTSTSTWGAAIENSNNASGDRNLYLTLGTNANNTSSYFIDCTTATVGPKFYVYGNGTYGTVSDQKLKKNIETTRDGYLEDLTRLRVVKYNWAEDPDGTPKELGWIAQELEQVFPGMVQDSQPDPEGNTVKEVKTSVLPFMLLKALQEAMTKIETLETQNADLLSRVTALEG